MKKLLIFLALVYLSAFKSSENLNGQYHVIMLHKNHVRSDISDHELITISINGNNFDLKSKNRLLGSYNTKVYFYDNGNDIDIIEIGTNKSVGIYQINRIVLPLGTFGNYYTFKKN